MAIRVAKVRIRLLLVRQQLGAEQPTVDTTMEMVQMVGVAVVLHPIIAI